MNNVTLTCMVNPTPSSPVTYQWNTTGCYTNSKFTGSNPQCFPHGRTTQNVTGNDLLAEDAGTITCTVTINGSNYTSEPFTLRISGEHIHQLLWFMYRGVFTLGVAVTSEDLTLADVRSYVIVSGSAPFIARCLTGLGPTSTSNGANGALGGLYFNGNMISNSGEQASCGSDKVQVRPGGVIAGIINVHRCEALGTAEEGVYTCTMMNSSMMEQSVRFHVYLNGRSESLDLYIPSLNDLSSLYTAAPVITPSSSNVTVNVSSSLTLSCTSRGSLPDTFTWKKDNDPTVLQSTSITAVDYTSTSAVFRADYSIDSVTTSDSGTYTCTATNPIGSDSASITVVVISKLLM